MLDGMVLNPYSMPGGAYSGFNLGMSAVHEAGCVVVSPVGLPSCSHGMHHR